MLMKKGQSILEYMLILAVIIAAVVIGAKTFIKPAVEQGLDDASSAMTTSSGKFSTMVGN